MGDDKSQSMCQDTTMREIQALSRQGSMNGGLRRKGSLYSFDAQALQDFLNDMDQQETPVSTTPMTRVSSGLSWSFEDLSPTKRLPAGSSDETAQLDPPVLRRVSSGQGSPRPLVRQRSSVADRPAKMKVPRNSHRNEPNNDLPMMERVSSNFSQLSFSELMVAESPSESPLGEQQQHSNADALDAHDTMRRPHLDMLSYDAVGFGCYPDVQSHQSAALGPFGPYNPAPAYLRDMSLQENHRSEPVQQEAVPDQFEGKPVIMVAGKHKGKAAFVQRKVNKKYRVQVEGVPYGLEFFPRSFQLRDSEVIQLRS